MHLCRVDLAAADNTAVWSIEDQRAVYGIEFTERKELGGGIASVSVWGSIYPAKVLHQSRRLSSSKTGHASEAKRQHAPSS